MNEMKVRSERGGGDVLGNIKKKRELRETRRGG